ncbi:MAG: orotate phosphoribosyltransferase [Clostridia bacterium]|nr:orotate phosphoribosyltransferase [Clostridia bacterium]
MSNLNSVKHTTKRKNLFLRVAKGHFATNDRHSNYYIDVVAQKARLSEAKAVAEELSSYFGHTTIVDTILCLDGTEVIGACLADQLTKADFVNMNAHKTIYVVTPEITNSSQLLFRDNIVPMIEGKHVMVLAVSYSSGKTVESAIDAINYYGGLPTGVSAIFSTVENSRSGLPVYSCFDPQFLGDYNSYPAHECPLCKAGQKIDALINCHGYSALK